MFIYNYDTEHFFPHFFTPNLHRQHFNSNLVDCRYFLLPLHDVAENVTVKNCCVNKLFR